MGNADVTITKNIPPVLLSDTWPDGLEEKYGGLPCTPKDLLQAIDSFGDTSKSFYDVCQSIRLRWSIALDIVHTFPEIKAYYIKMRLSHGKALLEQAGQLYANDGVDTLPKWGLITDKAGNLTYNQASVSFLRDKFFATMRTAEAYETGTAIQRHGVDARTISLNVTHESKDIEALGSIMDVLANGNQT